MATAAAKPPEEADENLWFRHPWEDEPDGVLASAMAALVARDPTADMPNLDMQRMNARFHPGTRLGRHRIEVGLDRNAALLVHQRGNTTSANSNPSAARGSRWSRSTAIAAPTGFVRHPGSTIRKSERTKRQYRRSACRDRNFKVSS
ncbi:MAG: hypothetical protein M3Y41_00180 [Pseudomonadota bacterium]|nr:hypothetical protein [Pseudomonadota bacterium]